MADNMIAEQGAATAVPVVDEHAAFKAELDRNMQVAFSGIIPREPEQSVATVQPDQTGAQEPVQQAPASVDTFAIFKEKFGYESPEKAVEEIQRLRALQENPEVKFENEDSATLFRAFQQGKTEEVYSFLHSQRQIEGLLNKEVDKDNAADIVKLGMQLKYKDLTSEEINYQFNKQFAIPSKPVQENDEDDIDYQSRVANWDNIVRDKTFELTIAAKQFKPELAAAKKQLTLPKIDDSVDEGYLQYKQMLEADAKADQETKEAYKALTPQHIETKIKFKDDANKIDFEFQYVPNSEDFGNSVNMVSDFNQFVGAYFKPDGTPDRQGFLQAIHFARNKDKIILEAMNQAKNATIKALLPDNNPDQRLQPTLTEPSELDREMQRALKGYGTFK